MKYREHEMVALQRDLPEHGLVKGDVGAVVHVHQSGGYEVEFVTIDGQTVALVALVEADIAPR